LHYDHRNALEYLAEADDIDRKIILAIRQGGHSNLSTMAKSIGISRVTLDKRIDKMKAKLKLQGW